jgi:hypothetical protein
MPDLKTITKKKGTSNPNPFKKLAVFGSRFIDYKMGLIGAGVMGCTVFGINYYDSYELYGASTAALKQLVYTFLFGGVIMRGCEYLAKRIRKQTLALAAATIIPSAFAIALTYGVHNMKGTPKPVESTIPTAVLVIPSTAIWGYRKRKQNTRPAKRHLRFRL